MSNANSKELLMKIKTREAVRYTDVYFIDCHAVTVAGKTETVTFGPFKKGKDESYLSDLVKTLIRMGEMFPEDTFNPIQSEYQDVEGYLGWFDTEHADADSFYDEYPDTQCEFSDYVAVADTAKQFGGTKLKWPMEPMTGDTPAQYKSFEVFYFDKDGVKHPTTIEFDG